MTDENLADNTDSTAEGETQTAEEFEIKLDTPDDASNKNPMISRIIGQRNKARDENEELRRKVQELESKITKPKESKPLPKLTDFSTDEEYERAVQNHYAKMNLNNQPKIDPLKEFQRQQSLTQGLDEHYRKASELAAKFPEYSKAEEAAAQTLGDELAQEIATRATNSAELMLYLGSNPNEAQRFKNLANNDPVQAGIELGRLDALVKVQSKTKKQLPEPDEPLESRAALKHEKRGPKGATFE